jgi:hypothetical protein
LLPFGSFVIFTNRRRSGKQGQLFLLSLSAFALLSMGIIAGCSSSTAPMTTPTTPTTSGTPTGQPKVTITATAGAMTQSTVVALTVQ